jgi:hypothetical protein
MVPDILWFCTVHSVQAVLFGAVRSQVLARPDARQSFVISGELQAVGDSISLCLTGV